MSFQAVGQWVAILVAILVVPAVTRAEIRVASWVDVHPQQEQVIAEATRRALDGQLEAVPGVVLVDDVRMADLLVELRLVQVPPPGPRRWVMLTQVAAVHVDDADEMVALGHCDETFARTWERAYGASLVPRLSDVRIVDGGELSRAAATIVNHLDREVFALQRRIELDRGE